MCEYRTAFPLSSDVTDLFIMLNCICLQVVGCFVIMAFQEKDVVRDKRQGVKAD